MCIVIAPAVMMGIAAATAVAGTATSVMAAQSQANATKAAANYQAQVAANNQTIAKRQVADTNSAEASAETVSRMRSAAQLGMVRATLGANGGDPNSGSALDLQSDTAKAGEMDALTIRSNYARQAYGYEVAGMSAGAQSGLDRAQAGFAETAGDIGTLSSIAGGASSLSGKWASWQLAAGNRNPAIA